MTCEPPRELPGEPGTQPNDLRAGRSFRRAAFLLPRVGPGRRCLRLGTDLHVLRFQAAVVFFPIGSAHFFVHAISAIVAARVLLHDLGLVGHFDRVLTDCECFGAGIDRRTSRDKVEAWLWLPATRRLRVCGFRFSFPLAGAPEGAPRRRVATQMAVGTGVLFSYVFRLVW